MKFRRKKLLKYLVLYNIFVQGCIFKFQTKKMDKINMFVIASVELFLCSLLLSSSVSSSIGADSKSNEGLVKVEQNGTFCGFLSYFRPMKIHCVSLVAFFQRFFYRGFSPFFPFKLSPVTWLCIIIFFFSFFVVFLLKSGQIRLIKNRFNLQNCEGVYIVNFNKKKWA